MADHLADSLNSADQLEEEGPRQQSDDSLAKPLQPKTEEQLIAEAFGQVKVLVEAGQQEGYLQMAPSEVRKFTLNSFNDFEVEKLDEAESQDLSKWATAPPLGPLVNRITPQDEQQLGKIQIDPITGERYMLVPIEVDLLVDFSKICDMFDAEIGDMIEQGAQENPERENPERENPERENPERERLEIEMLEKEMLEEEMLEKERLEKEMLEKEMLEKEMLEKERLEKEMLGDDEDDDEDTIVLKVHQGESSPWKVQEVVDLSVSIKAPSQTTGINLLDQEDPSKKETLENSQKVETEEKIQKEDPQEKIQKEETQESSQKEDPPENSQKKEAEEKIQKEDPQEKIQKEETQESSQKEETQEKIQKDDPQEKIQMEEPQKKIQKEDPQVSSQKEDPEKQSLNEKEPQEKTLGDFRNLGHHMEAMIIVPPISFWFNAHFLQGPPKNTETATSSVSEKVMEGRSED